MKSTVLIPLLFLLIVTPAFGQLSDRTGLVNRFDVKAGGHSFEVQTVANFDVVNHKFDQDKKRLTIFINSGLENNLGELIVPKSLLGGNFTFYLNDEPYYPTLKSNDKISFIIMNFTGVGKNQVDIIATNVLGGTEDKPKLDADDKPPANGGGCLIATATYGTELASQVQQLREIRDNKLMKTTYGQYFMDSFNAFYYSFSPAVADYERENPIFKESVKLFVTPLISSLSLLSYFQMDNDAQVLGIGISIITLNMGFYFVIPVMLIVKLKRLLAK